MSFEIQHPNPASRKWKLLLAAVAVVSLAAGGVLVYRLHRLQILPSAAWHCLHEPQQMILYSIHPEEPADSLNGAAVFHGFRIIGQVTVSAKSDQQRIAETMRHAVLSAFGKSACFNPRHGIRVTDGRHTCDFMVSFECGSMEYYLDNATVGSAAISGSDEAFNAILRGPNSPLAE